MKKRVYAKRLLALVLSMLMMIGTIPATVFAENTPAAQSNDPIYVLAGGDFQAGDNGQADHYYSRINMGNILDRIKEKYSSMDGFIFVGDYDGDTHNDSNAAAGIAAMMEEVSGRYDTLNHENSILLEGNHETNAVSGIDPTGGYDFDGYSVYALNETEYCEKQEGKGEQILAAADNLETWLNDKLGEGCDAPIFVTTHVPLAYGTRTYTNGDGLYAKYVFDVLNTAAENGLNIIFMHGHDHAYGADNYLGGEAIYLPKGDKINIAVPGEKTKWTEETLNFTYMNAGYVGYYNENYYNVNSYEEEKLTMTVFKIENNQVTVERYSKDGLYNLKSAGREGFYANAGTCATIGLSYNTAVYASPQTITLAENTNETAGTIGEYVGVTGEAADDVTTSGNDWTTITEPVAGTTTYTYTQATSIEAGKEYVIVGNDHTVALMDNNGSMGKQDVTISDSGNTMTSDTALTKWKFSGSSRGNVYNGTHYLRYNNGNFSLGTLSTLFFTNNGSNFRIYSGNYSFYYNGSSWTRSDRNTAQYVRLYQWTDTTTSEAVQGLYGRLDGVLTYPVAAGTSAADALAAVKAGIAIEYATAADYSDENEYLDDGEGMTWTLDPNYDGNLPGDYAVTIAYNGVTLGIAEVVVPASTTYYIAEGNGLYVVAMNTTEADAMNAVKDGVTVSSATNASGANKTVIADSQVTWRWVDTYNATNAGPYTVEILKDGTSLGTVEVKVDVKYDTGIKTDWTYIGETEATEGTHIYTLDTNGIDSGSTNKYLIVARDQAYLLDAGSAVAVTISSDGKTATTSTRDYEYYFTGSASGLITRDGSNTLYQQNWGIHTGYIEDSNLDKFTNLNNGYYRIYDGDGTARSLYYNGSSWTVTNENHTSSTYAVRLYKYTGTSGGTAGGSVYALLEGNTVYTVVQGSSATKALAAVKNGITGYTASDANGTNKTELADGELTWKWKNTFDGNSTGSYWVEISYKGKVLGTVEVQVKPGTVNDYPEYPDEGAVKVNKTATGIDFPSSGIAQVEISASGVPIKKGADVIVMLDTSSSMENEAYLINGVTRSAVLEESLKNLIAQFKAPGADGEPLDIRVAIADFNGFYGADGAAGGTAYDRDADDTLSDKISYEAVSAAKVYTGTGNLTAGAFIPAKDLADTYTLNYSSGTNYDYAMDAIYQMGTAIQAANTDEERDLYVIFMSDGAAMQWNYYHSNGRSTNWQYWITGAWDAETVENNLACTEHAYYYAEDVDGDGYVNEHRMADAIKGDPSESYEVIRKTNDLGTAVDGYDHLYQVPGLGATMFAIAFDPQTDQQTPPEAMEKSIQTLASDQHGSTQYYYRVETADELSDAFDAIGSDIAYAAYNARFVDQMGNDYNLQMKTSAYEVADGTNKTLAPKIEILSYDIYTRQDYLDGRITADKIGDRKGTYTVLETVTFNADGTEAYSDQIDDGQTNILADGTQDGYVKGVIYAKTFLYNTNALAVAVEGVNIPTSIKSDNTTAGSTNVLPAETFYWKMGTVQNSELAMRYYVYLDGSMEGTRAGGSYPTNEYATLYYDNYLDHPCYKETVSPVMPWKEANVSYAFYLVNKEGEIIVNQTTGQTGSFANKIAVTNPVVYETVLLNTNEEVSVLDIASLGVLPEGYTLYDYNGTDGATYTVNIKSNTTGDWKITSVADVPTTYVMQYDPENAAAYSNEKEVSKVGLDYTHTVVWFAVLWEVQALPDAVVIDYGLPVEISVLANDMFGDYGSLAGVGAYDELNLDGYDSQMKSGFGASYAGTYGAAAIDTKTNKVRYELDKSKGMQMQSYEKFAYAVHYTGSANAGYYYDTVTVIPATTIYYEDDYVTLKSYTWQSDWTEVSADDERYVWSVDGTTVDGVQAEDRPGQYSLTDANNLYGYDSVNLSMSKHSMGSAKKATVDYDNKGTATFEFYGTGFDIVSMTSNMTGSIYVDVYQTGADDKDVLVEGKSFMVDSYYGYNRELYNVTYIYQEVQVSDTETECQWIQYLGEKAEAGAKEEKAALYENAEIGTKMTGVEYVWVVNPDANNSIYQVPLMQVEDLPYGKYKAVITASYNPMYDNVKGSADYDFYLDAIRIYDPANDGMADGTVDKTIENAYVADGEGWPSYIELRDKIIEKDQFGYGEEDSVVAGMVFIDGQASGVKMSDYVNYGPNNEVYLAPGQSVAFILQTPANIARVNLGIKSADGKKAAYTIKNIAKAANSETGVAAGSVYNENTYTIDTTTDMYYDLTGWIRDIIVITNTSSSYGMEGMISLTNIKSTYTSDPNTEVQTVDSAALYSAADDSTVEEGSLTYMYMTPTAAALTLRSLNTPVEEEPDEIQPEEPDTTPDTPATEPENPDTTPDTPETETPEEKPDNPITAVIQAVGKVIVNVVKSLLDWLFW